MTRAQQGQETYEGRCSGCGYRLHVLCWHPGREACWRDNRPSGGEAGGERMSDRPLFNAMRPRNGQVKPELVMHICASFYCCSILLRYAQRATNKAQFHLVPISPSLPAFLSPPLRRPIWTSLRMQRYRSLIEVAFQCNPHRVHDRVLLKRKEACGGRLQV